MLPIDIQNAITTGRFPSGGEAWVNSYRIGGWQILCVNATISFHIDLKNCQRTPTIVLQKPCTVRTNFNFCPEGVYQPDHRNQRYYERDR